MLPFQVVGKILTEYLRLEKSNDRYEDQLYLKRKFIQAYLTVIRICKAWNEKVIVRVVPDYVYRIYTVNSIDEYLKIQKYLHRLRLNIFIPNSKLVERFNDAIYDNNISLVSSLALPIFTKFKSLRSLETSVLDLGDYDKLSATLSGEEGVQLPPITNFKLFVHYKDSDGEFNFENGFSGLAPTLETFYIRFFKDFGTFKGFPVMKQFDASLPKLSLLSSLTIQFSHISQNLINVMLGDLHHLKHLDLFKVTIESSKDISQVLLWNDLLSRFESQTTITNLELCSIRSIDIAYVVNLINKNTTLKELKLGFSSHEESDSPLVIRNQTLERVEFKTDSSDSTVLFRRWSGESNIRAFEIQFNSSDIWKEFLVNSCRNSIRELSVSVSDSVLHLTDFPNLKSLYLGLTYDSKPWLDFILRHGHLTYLCYREPWYFTFSEVSTIIEKSPSLIEISLPNVDWDPPKFKIIKKSKSLRYVSIRARIKAKHIIGLVASLIRSSSPIEFLQLEAKNKPNYDLKPIKDALRKNPSDFGLKHLSIQPMEASLSLTKSILNLINR